MVSPSELHDGELVTVPHTVPNPTSVPNLRGTLWVASDTRAGVPVAPLSLQRAHRSAPPVRAGGWEEAAPAENWALLYGEN